MTFQIGDWTIDSDANTARRGGETQRLEARSVAVLKYLSDNRDRVVSKDELLEAVWQKHAISDHSVAVVISDLRRTLGDDSRNPRYIQTVPRKGYRLIADAPLPPEPGLPAGTPSEPPTAPARRMTGWIGAAAVIVLFGAAGIVAAVTSRMTFDDPVSTDGPAFASLPFTTLPGREVHPSLSPDGGQVVYSWNKGFGLDFDLYVKPIGSENALQITTTPEWDFWPAWSPKGNLIAFGRRKAGECHIFVVPPIGGAEREITECANGAGSRPVWTPDAGHLIYSGLTEERKVPHLRIVDIATFENRALTEPPDGILSEDFASLSPDGTSLAFTRSTEVMSKDLYVVDFDPQTLDVLGEPRRLSHRDMIITDIDWSEDGRTIIAGTDWGGAFGLWTIPIDGGDPRPVRDASHWIYGVALSPNQTRWILDHRMEASNIVLADLHLDGEYLDEKGHPKRPMGDGRFLFSSTRFEWAGQFSPDGRRVVFASDRTGPAGFWLMNTDGTGLKHLTSSKSSFLYPPRWAPEAAGNKIAYSMQDGGNFDIYIVEEGGRPPRRLTRIEAADVVPRWSPDGGTLYFGSDRTGSWEIWAIDLQSDEMRQITENGGKIVEPSADGKSLYFTKPDVEGIWQLSLDNPPEERLVYENLPLKYDFLWTVVQDDLFVLRYSHEGGEHKRFITRINLETGEHTDVYQMPNTFFFEDGIAISPDGTQILYSEVTRYEGDLHQIERPRLPPASR